MNRPTNSVVGDGISSDCAVFTLFMNWAVVKKSVGSHAECSLWSTSILTPFCDNGLVLEIRSPHDGVNLKSAPLLVIRPTRKLTTLRSSGLK